MFSAISNLFGYLLNFLYELVNNNYGVAIILFSLVLRIILLPITIKQQISMEKTNKIQGEIKKLKVKYKNNQEMLNKETMELYKKEKISPFSGCLSTILQLIIILSVFYLVKSPLTYMKKVDPEIINTYKEQIKEENGGKLSAYYEIEIINKKAHENNAVNINMNFLNLDLSKIPNQNMDDYKVYIIPILYVISSFISIKVTSNMQNKLKNEENQTDELNPMADMGKGMSYIMPMMTLSIAFIAPLGLALYWFISNLLILIERFIIRKFVSLKESE